MATALAAVALLVPPVADSAARNPGPEELWEEYPLDAKRDLPMPRDRLPEARPRAAPPVRPAAAPRPDGTDTTVWVVIVVAGAAVVVAAVAGALAYVGHTPRLPRGRLPARPSMLPRRLGWNAAVAAAGGARSAQAALSHLIPAVERPPTGRRVVNDLVRAARAAVPRDTSKEAQMRKTRDREVDAEEIDVLKANPRAEDIAKHALPPEAETVALKRKPRADALKAKVGGEGAPDKERLAGSDAVAVKEKLAATAEPERPKLRKRPARAKPRMSRPRARRALRRVPAPDFIPSRSEVCEVRWWRGYLESQFTAVAMEADGTKARTVASSPYFHWRQRVPPDESGAAAAALRELAETLEHDGWKPAGRGEEWFAVRFERELVLDGVGSMTDDESTVIRRSEAMAIRADQARVILLCERLVDATAAGATEWSGEGDDHFRWERAEGTVSIGARDRDGQPPYELVVFSGNGERVEELASALVDDDRPAEWNEPLAELYRVARRSALHADEIIAALMQSLPPSASEEPTAAAPAAERPE